MFVLHFFGSWAGLEGVEVVVEIVVLSLNPFHVGSKVLIWHFLCFEGSIYLFEIDVKINERDDLFILKNILEGVKLLMDPSDERK